MGVVSRNFRKTEKASARPGPPSTSAKGAVPKSKATTGGMFALDQNQDGSVDMLDILESNTRGEAVEDRIMRQQRFPFFIVLQTLVALAMWAGGSITRGGDFLSNKAGLDTFSSGWSDLRIFGPECQDYRAEVWRYVFYQWTHVGCSHILMNSLMNVILGIPLEGLHGPVRMALMYNVGVFGGACCYWVGDGHKSVVGMSGGCYALIGMHLSDLMVNWNQKKFRKPTLLFLIVLASFDIMSYVLALGSGNASHTAHVGGVVAGMVIGVMVGKNVVVLKWERRMKLAVTVIGLALLCFCITWLAIHKPPQNVAESYGWCWLRQIYNPVKFGSDWACIKCGTEDCIKTFANEKDMDTVASDQCATFIHAG